MTRRFTAKLLAAIGLGACGGGDAPPLELPEPIEQASPFVYPEDLWDRNIEGQAVVMVHVSTDGAVDSAYVRTTSGYEAMDSAAITGAKLLRFRPGRRGADPVGVWVRLPVRFSKSPPAAGAQADAGGQASAQGAEL